MYGGVPIEASMENRVNICRAIQGSRLTEDETQMVWKMSLDTVKCQRSITLNGLFQFHGFSQSARLESGLDACVKTFRMSWD